MVENSLEKYYSNVPRHCNVFHTHGRYDKILNLLTPVVYRGDYLLRNYFEYPFSKGGVRESE